MKRSGQIEIITAVIIILISLAGSAGATITWSGDVDPADPSAWDLSTAGYIGKTGNGTMGITGGDAVSNGYGYIGFNSGSTGEVTVDGANSTWTDNGELIIGYSGNGTLNITGGSAVSNNSWGYIGFNSGSTGKVTVDGVNSTWANNSSLRVGDHGSGTLEISNGGLVSVAGLLTIDYHGNGDDFINMSTGGMLALHGDGDDSIVDFLGLAQGTGAIRYWDSSIARWADITGATYGLDYTLEYLTVGELAGYTMLTVGTVPEPGMMALFCAGGLIALRSKKAKQ